MVTSNQGAQNSSPLVYALIPGDFVKVRKTPPLILRTLSHQEGAAASVLRCAELPPPGFAHLKQNCDSFRGQSYPFWVLPPE